MPGKNKAATEREFFMRITPSLIKYLLAFWGLALVSLHLYAALTGSSTLWGVDSWSYFPLSVTAILFLVGSVFLFSYTSRPLVSFFENTFARVLPAFKLFRGYPAAGLLAAAAGGLFWLLHCRVHLLGDGYLLIRTLEKDNWSHKTGTLAGYLTWLTREFIGRFTEVTPLGAYQIVSVISGMIFVYLLYLLACRMGKQEGHSALIFLGLLTLGSTQLFSATLKPIRRWLPLCCCTYFWQSFSLKAAAVYSGRRLPSFYAC